jgi:hypothetical protein
MYKILTKVHVKLNLLDCIVVFEKSPCLYIYKKNKLCSIINFLEIEIVNGMAEVWNGNSNRPFLIKTIAFAFIKFL